MLFPLIPLSFFFEGSGLSAVFVLLSAVYFYGWFRVLLKQRRESKDSLITMGPPRATSCYVPKKNTIYLDPESFGLNPDRAMDDLAHELIHASLYKTGGKRRRWGV